MFCGNLEGWDRVGGPGQGLCGPGHTPSSQAQQLQAPNSPFLASCTSTRPRCSCSAAPPRRDPSQTSVAMSLCGPPPGIKELSSHSFWGSQHMEGWSGALPFHPWVRLYLFPSFKVPSPPSLAQPSLPSALPDSSCVGIWEAASLVKAHL